MSFYTEKNKLIDTLKNKITLIEDYYQKSLSYHQIVFKLIDKLITDYNRTKSVSIFQDLNNICNFDFPKMEEHKVSLDTRISNFLYFLSNKSVVDRKTSFFEQPNCKELILNTYSGGIIKSNTGKIIIRKLHRCLIRYPYDDYYSLILTSPHKDDFYTIIEINSNQLLCSEANGNHVYICTYTHNSYKYIKLPKYHKSSHLFLIGKDKNILSIASDNYFISFQLNPYLVTQKSKINFKGFMSILYQMSNENILIKGSNPNSIIEYDYKKENIVNIFTFESNILGHGEVQFKR